MEDKQVESVYCEFTQLPADSGTNPSEYFVFICVQNYLNAKNYQDGMECYDSYTEIYITCCIPGVHWNKVIQLT